MRGRLVVLGIGCLFLVGVTWLMARDTSEEGVVKRALAELPEVSRESDSGVWAWQRTGPMPSEDVERRLAQALEGRRGWAHNALGWNYNPYATPEPWYRRIPFLRGRVFPYRPILWLQVRKGKAVPKGEASIPVGRWTTVRLSAMAVYKRTEPPFVGWTILPTR